MATEMAMDGDAGTRAARRAWTVKTFGITDPGRVRPSNEDQFLIAELTKAMRISQTSLPEARAQFGDERGHLFLVADGMGGHKGGEKASALAVFAIQEFTLNTLKWFFESNTDEAQRVLAQFRTALRQADVRVREEAAEHRELSGMGTTVTMAYHLDAQLCVIHVGDSRAYVYRKLELHQLTRDHTFTADLVRSGAIRQEDVAKHPFRHVITNVVGGNDAGVNVEAHAVEVQPGDRLLLCSDGLTEMLTNDAIATTLGAEADPERACRRLVAQANEAGGRDNITVVIVRFD
jgi:serine/threonine protein phosphatase PrpC